MISIGRTVAVCDVYERQHLATFHVRHVFRSRNPMKVGSLDLWVMPQTFALPRSKAFESRVHLFHRNTLGSKVGAFDTNRLRRKRMSNAKPANP